MQEYRQERKYQYQVNGLTYIVTLVLTQKSLFINLEEAVLVDTWNKEFTNNEIEQLTNKMGYKMNNQRFADYLIIALNKKLDTSFLDILSAYDLQIMRKKKGQVSQTKSNKRYIILTIILNNNRLHFPLPLNVVECKQQQKLIQVIKILRNNWQDRKDQSVSNQLTDKFVEKDYLEADRIKNENERLKIMIKELQTNYAQKKGAVELDMILKNKIELQNSLNQLEKQKFKHINKLKMSITAKQKEIASVSHQLDVIKKEMIKAENNDPTAITKLKNYAFKAIKVTQMEINAIKKLIQKQLRQVGTINRQIEKTKNLQKRSLGKIKQIQIDIQNAKKKANTKQISNRLHSNSPASVSSKKSYNTMPQNPKIIQKNSITKSQKSQKSAASSVNSKPRSYAAPIKNNNRPNPRIVIPTNKSNMSRTTPYPKVPQKKLINNKNKMTNNNIRLGNRTLNCGSDKSQSKVSNSISNNNYGRTRNVEVKQNKINYMKELKKNPSQKQNIINNNYKKQKKPEINRRFQSYNRISNNNTKLTKQIDSRIARIDKLMQKAKK